MRILIVDDSNTYSALFKRYLEAAGYTTLHVPTGEEALQLLDIETIDIILLDVSMAGLNGFETAQIIRETFTDKWLPIIFVTADSDQQLYKQAVESGGDDFLVKPVGKTALTSKVAAMGRLLQQHQDLHKTNAALKASNQHDQLTGLLNRHEALNQGKRAWQAMQHLNHPITVLMIDIDHFKQFNDSYGHIKGDECLHAIATSLQQSVKASGGIIGRFGGEEFICILPNTQTPSGIKVGQKIISGLEQLNYPYPDSTLGRVSVSIGCAGCSAVNRHQLEAVIQHADSRLYEAKNAGRNQVCWDDYPTSQQLLRDESEVSADLQKSLSSPKYSLFNKRNTLVSLASAATLILFIALITDKPPKATIAKTALSETIKQVQLEPVQASQVVIQSNSIALDKANISALIDDWANAWETKNTRVFFSFYHSDFVSSNGQPLSQWQQKKQSLIINAGEIAVAVQNLNIAILPASKSAIVIFDQHYHSEKITDFGSKRLLLVNDGNAEQWKIIEEIFSKDS